MTLIDSKMIAEPAEPAGSGADLPRHVAIIMDGNGRWAAKRGLPRVEGHRRGVEAVRRTVRAAGEIGVEVLTLYSFSAENWSRPRAEVAALMGLLRHFVGQDLAELHSNGVRVRIIGEREGLDNDLRRLIDHCETLTRDNANMTLIVAFNYGARQEIAAAVRRIAERVAAGELTPGAIDQAVISTHLDTAGLPEPDLLIRTSGEKRLSNFLLWQSAYSELVFIADHWPDFDRAHLEAAIAEYRARERRYGGLSRVAVSS